MTKVNGKNISKAADIFKALESYPNFKLTVLRENIEINMEISDFN